MLVTGIVAFIISILTTTCAIVLVSLCKDKKPRNKVRFFVMIGLDGKPGLYIKDINGKYYPIVNVDDMSLFGLNAFEFVDMPFEEVREVFINLEN